MQDARILGIAANEADHFSWEIEKAVKNDRRAITHPCIPLQPKQPYRTVLE